MNIISSRNCGKVLAVSQMILKYYQERGEITVAFTSVELRERVLLIIEAEIEKGFK